MTDCIQTSFPWASKKIEAKFDSRPLSSDGGLLLLRSADEKLKLLERAAILLTDRRDSRKVRHKVREILR